MWMLWTCLSIVVIFATGQAQIYLEVQYGGQSGPNAPEVPGCQPGATGASGTCSTPGLPHGLVRSFPDASFQGPHPNGSRVLFFCNEKYEPVPDGRITSVCLVDSCNFARWNPSPPTCQQPSCPDPGDPLNGRKLDGVYTVGSTVRYECNIGYSLEGSPTVTCLTEKQWNTSIPTCVKIRCGDPGTPLHGRGNSTDYTYRSTIGYTCSMGYSVYGVTHITCGLDGEWSDRVPTCQLVHCGDPGAICNGDVIGGSYTYGSVVQYRCVPGYILIGSSAAVCGADGIWNSTRPTCTADSCPPAVVANSWSYRDTHQSLGATKSFNCHRGHVLVGVATVTCQIIDNMLQWDRPLPTCQRVSCGDPGAPSHGRKIGTLYTYQATVQYECNHGYRIEGSTALYCGINGKWNGTAPTCSVYEFRCSFNNDFCGLIPILVVTARWIPGTNQIKFGQDGLFRRGLLKSQDFNKAQPQDHCLRLRTLIGDSQQGSLTIRDQKFNYLWSSKGAFISSVWHTVVLPVPSAVTSLYFVAENRRPTTGDIIIDDMDVVIGPCQERGVCSDPGVPLNGNKKSPGMTSYPAGAVVTYECRSRYRLSGSASTTCLPSGYWTNPHPICILNISLRGLGLTESPDPEGMICNNVRRCEAEYVSQTVEYMEMSTRQRCCLEQLGAQEPCKDILTNCAQYRSFCSDSSVRERCAQTCGCTSGTPALSGGYGPWTAQNTTAQPRIRTVQPGAPGPQAAEPPSPDPQPFTGRTTGPTMMPTTTIPTVPPRRITTRPTRDPVRCTNKSEDCHLYRGFCADSWVVENCQGMCRCGRRATAPPPARTTTGPCIDIWSNCHFFTSDCWQGYVSRHCRATCGVCTPPIGK